MARKRSRSLTEQSFQQAVLNLVADSGCAKIGVNLVAERARSDKVLIYRYFGDLDGLLQSVADSRSWLPESGELVNELSGTPVEVLRKIYRAVCQHVQGDPATRQIARWRHAASNPLTEKFNREWSALWQELAEALARGQSHAERKKWTRTIELLALVTAAKICGERVDEDWLPYLAAELEPAGLPTELPEDKEDMLPTNLL